MTTEIRFFALQSKKEEVLDRGQNDFKCESTTTTVVPTVLTGPNNKQTYVRRSARGCLGYSGKASLFFCVPDRGCKLYMFEYVHLYTLVRVFRLKPAYYHRRTELRPTIKQRQAD